MITEYVCDMATVPQISLVLFCFERTCYIIYSNNMQNCTKETNTIEILLIPLLPSKIKPNTCRYEEKYLQKYVRVFLIPFFVTKKAQLLVALTQNTPTHTSPYRHTDRISHLQQKSHLSLYYPPQILAWSLLPVFYLSTFSLLLRIKQGGKKTTPTTNLTTHTHNLQHFPRLLPSL